MAYKVRDFLGDCGVIAVKLCRMVVPTELYLSVPGLVTMILSEDLYGISGQLKLKVVFSDQVQMLLAQ